MLVGYFVEHRGYKGTIEFSMEDSVYYGSLVAIEDSVSYHAKSPEELYDAYCRAIDDYIKYKEEVSTL